MVDRQEIDALLIGALYGELTPAEEARLQSHLESHPADRSALDDLRSARHAVRESRIFDLQADPPQSVSALVLQEAHRRAPRTASAAGSWFSRLARAFAMHPAMAVAATLVLVLGVAGTLYVTNGDEPQVAESKKDTAAPAASPAQVAITTPPPQERGRGELEQQPADNEKVDLPAGSSVQVALAEEQDVRADGSVAKRAPAKNTNRPTPSGGIVVSRAEPRPKELEGGRYRPNNDKWDEVGVGGVGGAATATNGRTTTVANTGFAAADPSGAPGASPAAPPSTPAPMAKAQPPIDDLGAGPGRKGEVTKATEDAGWAQAQLNQAVSLARSGNCTEAASIVMQIRTRAPAFFRDHAERERDLKACGSYITNAIEKAEDQSRPVRAKKPSPAADTH
jgi:hypothetical protein